MAEDPDRPLLVAVARGNEAALRELIERHQDKLFRFVYRQVRNAEDATEIVAETFVRVHRYADRYRPRAKVVTWIYSIATNLCRDFHRHSKRRSFFSRIWSDFDANEERPAVERIRDKTPTADHQLMQAEEAAHLRALIDDLPLKLKTAFILHVLEEYPQKVCAEMLGVSEKTIETRIYRARKRLQAQVSKESPIA